jgi:hypothetical protein
MVMEYCTVLSRWLMGVRLGCGRNSVATGAPVDDSGYIRAIHSLSREN